MAKSNILLACAVVALLSIAGCGKNQNQTIKETVEAYVSPSLNEGELLEWVGVYNRNPEIINGEERLSIGVLYKIKNPNGQIKKYDMHAVLTIDGKTVISLSPSTKKADEIINEALDKSFNELRLSVPFSKN